MNKKIIEEYLLLNQAFLDAKRRTDRKVYNDYIWYNGNMKECYTFLISKYANVLGIQNLQTEQEIRTVLSSMELTSEQKRALNEIRKEPVFKKLMGEVAISKKDILEKILGQEITVQGMMYADEQGPRQSVKSVEILGSERQAIYDKLSSQLSSGSITQEQYTDFLNQVDYIYNYYESMSVGQQIPFRKIGDGEIANIKKKADEEGIDFNTALTQKNDELIEDFKDFHDEIRGTKEQKSTISNPKYAEFKAEIEKKEKDIKSYRDRKKQIEALLDDLYKQEREIGKDLPLGERTYQKLVIQIKQKELEIKSMEIEASIKNTKNFIYQRELGLFRMEGILTPEQYSFQIEEAKANYEIDDLSSTLTCTLEESDLYTMQIRLATIQLERGEITKEQKDAQYQELKTKIGKNDEYIGDLNTDISSKRKKQIEKQIAFRYSQGMITKETRQAQLEALAVMRELTGNTQVDISNVFVDEEGITHGPRR